MQQIQKKEYEAVAELIQGYLEEMELVPFDMLPTEKDIYKKLKLQKFFENGITTQEMECATGDEQALFICFDRNKDFEAQLKPLAEGILGDGSSEECYFVIFVRTVEDKGTVENLKPKIKSWIREWMLDLPKSGKEKRAKIKFSILHAPTREEKTFTVGIRSRICALHYVPEREEGVRIASNVYAAKLFDVVKLYGQVGTELFERNVRYHIGDILNVESEIHKTLMNRPENFFNFNNGIAIQVRKREALDIRDERWISLTYAEKGDLSIINGAQTISAAADFFFQQVEGTETLDDLQRAIEQAKKQAWVLLRVFYAESDQQKDSVEAFNEISISLNRQKPISPMDIGYTCPTVAEINKLYEGNKTDPYYFRILKRGQSEVGRGGRFKYQLADFGRMVTAYYFDDPAVARAGTTQNIIRYQELTEDDGEGKGAAKTIYAPLEGAGDKKALFMKWYRPINFANEIAELYSQVEKQYRKEEEIDANILAILGNGRYFFVTYVVNMLNGSLDGEEDRSFAEFNYTVASVESAKESVHELIQKYAELVAEFAVEYLKTDHSSDEQTRNTLNSNDFKKADFYKKWQAYAKTEKKVLAWNEMIKKALEPCDKEESAAS